MIHEEGRLLIVVMRLERGNQAKLDLVRDAYKRAFNQDSVLLVRQPAIAAF